MFQVTLIPRRTSPHADGIQIQFDSVPIVPGLFKPQQLTLTEDILLSVAGKDAFRVPATDVTLSGACLLGDPNGGPYEILSGRLVIGKKGSDWPDPIKNYLADNWFADLSVKAIAIGNDGLQLEVDDEGQTRTFRWSPVRVTADPSVVRVRWQELTDTAQSISLLDTELDTVGIRLAQLKYAPSGEGAVVVERYLQRTQRTDLVPPSKLTIERPGFGLHLLGRDWFPETCWSWGDGNNEIFEFVDIAAGDWEPDAELDAELDGKLTATATTDTTDVVPKGLQITKMPPLLTTGRTADDTSELPAAWQYATINANGGGTAAGVWVHWNLSLTDVPSLLAVQSASLDSNLHGLWAINQLDWSFEFGLKPQPASDQPVARDRQEPPRIRLRLTKTKSTSTSKWSATLAISDPQVFGRSPELQFFGRPMLDASALPHAPELALSLTTARVEFANVEFKDPAKMQVSAKLVDGTIKFVAGPQAVEAWVPGPWAGLNDVSLTGANLPADVPSSENPIKLVRDRNQGLVDLPLGDFSLRVAKDVLAEIAFDTQPSSQRTGPTVATLLPWTTWSVTNATTHLDIYHRNLQLEHFEQQQTQRPKGPESFPKSDGIMLPPSNPMSAPGEVQQPVPVDSDFLLRVEMEYDRVRALRDRFARAAAPIEATSGDYVIVENWFHPKLKAKVGIDRPTELGKPPKLNWTITGLQQSASLEVGSRENILEGGLEWAGAVVPDDATLSTPKISVTDAKDGLRKAEFLASNGHVSPVFRTAAIRCLDAAEVGLSEIGQTLLVVYVDEADRTFAWFPSFWKEPRQLTDVTGSLNQIRIVLTADKAQPTEFMIAAMVDGKAKIWSCAVDRDNNDLPRVGSILSLPLPVTGSAMVTSLHSIIAQLNNVLTSMLLVGHSDGNIAFYSRSNLQNIVQNQLATVAPDRPPLNFDGRPIDRMDFRNQAANSPQTQTLLAGTHNGSEHLIHVAVWKNDIAPTALLFASADATPNDKKCPRLIVADNTPILGMALQGFDSTESGQTKDTLYVWGIVKDNNVTRTCQWNLLLPVIGSTADLLPIQVLGTSAETLTGFVPPDQALLGDVSQLAFGDRTEVESRFLVAVTAAGAGQSSSWAQWEPDWDLRQESVPAKSFFQVLAHRGRVTGASVVPRLKASVVLATGGDDGAVIVWDVESGQELYRWQPRDWFIDGLGGVRLAAPKGTIRNDFYVERLAQPHFAGDPEFIVISTSPTDGAGAVQLVLTSDGKDLNLVCNSLLLIRIGTTDQWTVAPADPGIATPLGTIGVYGKQIDGVDDLHSISNWPRIGGHPFYPVDAIFTFAGDPLDDPQPQKIEITGVLLNPADLQDVVASTAALDPSQPEKRVNLFGQAPWFVHHSNQEIRVTLERIGTADGAYDVAGVTGTFDWTFPLADQIPPPSVDRSVPGRLSSLSGVVSWNFKTSSLLLSVEGKNSLADALGREWSLTQPIDLKLERSNPRQLLIRESLPDSSATLLARRTLPHLSDGSQTSVIEQGRGPNGELLALTATDAQKGPSDLFVSEVDTGRRILHCQDRYRDGVLTLRGSSDRDAQPIDAVLVHVDGTVRVWPALSSKNDTASGTFVFEPLLPQAERRRLQPDSSVEAVVVFDGLDKPKDTASPGQHHRLYLLRCADGSARLWDDRVGEVWRFDLPDTIVTAIAIAPSLGTISFDKFVALQPTKFGGPRPINQVLDAVTTVIALGGADGSVRCFLIERELPKLGAPGAPPICFYEHPKLGAEVTSVSLAFDAKALQPNGSPVPGLFVLACCRNGESTSLIEILSKLPYPLLLDLKPVRARLATTEPSLFIAAEVITDSKLSVEIYSKNGIAQPNRHLVNGSSQLSTFALCEAEGSNAIFAAGGQALSFAEVDTTTNPINLSTDGLGGVLADQALSLINVNAGNVLLAIDGNGQARLFRAPHTSPPTKWTLVDGFAPQDSQKVVAATFADTVVPVALRVAESRIEVWDLDFDSRRWVSPAEIGTFTPKDLSAVCFQFVNGRPILAVGRVGFVEFWNLSNRQLERQMACGGTVNQLDLKVDELGEPQVLIGLEGSQATVKNQYRQQFVRGTTANYAVALERQKDATNSADEKLCVTYWEKSTNSNPIQFFISPGEEGAKILHFDAVHFEQSTKIVVVVNLAGGASPGPFSWVFDNSAPNAGTGASGWMILDSKGEGKSGISDVNAETGTQTLEAKPDRTVSRVFTNDKWTTTETIGSGPSNILVREHHTGVEQKLSLPLQNLRLSEANWPVVAAISTASNIRLWDRLSGVLRQTWSANIEVAGNSEPLKPLAKGLLGISSGTDPSLLVAGEQGLLLYRFRTGEFALPRPQSMKQVALAWEPTAEAFPLAAAWSDDTNTTCCADKLAGFIKSSNITAETAVLTSLTLSWQPEPTAENRWHLSGSLSGSTGLTSSVYALDNPADAAKARLLGSLLPGSILAMAWPTALDQGPVRVINTLRPDRGPRRDVSRLLLAVDNSGTLELQEAILPETDSQSLTIVAKWATEKESDNSAVLALVDDDLGVRLVASVLNAQNKGATVMVPTPWLRISSTGAPQFDLQVKLLGATDTKFLGRITRYRHFELDILKGTIPEVNVTLVARPALVQGDAFTFNVEPVANDSSKFLHGAMVLWETGDINPPEGLQGTLTGLQGTLIWETCETSTPVTFEFDGSDIQDVSADTRTLTTVTISNSQFGTTLHSYVTGVIHHDQEPRWELHIAEQPNGAAFAFLFQADLQGFVPVQIAREDANAKWSITVSKTLFASAELTAAESSGSSTPRVRDDVFLPLSKDDGSLALSSGQVVDLVDSSIGVLTSDGFGILSMNDTKGFVFQTLKSTSDVPLDLIGGIDSTIAIPKQAIDVPQLVHRRDLGGRLRAARNGFKPLLEVGDLNAAVVHRRISPVMTDDTRAAVLFESLNIRPSSPAPSNSVGLSVMRTESVMVLTCPEFLDPSTTQAVDIARNLLTATTSSSIGFGLPSEIFNDEAIRSHALQVGSTGILLKRTLDTKGQIQFTFVNSPYHALEPQTLAGNKVSESVPNSDTPRGSTSPQWLSPSDAARLQLMAATKRFELTRPKADLATTRTLRFTASQALIPPLNQLNQPWRVAVAEHTLFDDFDSIDEDESQTVSEKADRKIFLPTDLTLRYGVDKPGAAQVHQLRAVLPDNDRFARTQPTLATLREPQQIQTPTETPTDSKLEIMSAVLPTIVDQTDVPGVTSLLINWKETIGTEPIGNLSNTIEVLQKPNVPTEYIIKPVDGTGASSPHPPIAAFERIGERLVAISPNEPVLITVDNATDRAALKRLSVYLVSQFNLSNAFTVDGLIFTAQMMFNKDSLTPSLKPLTDYFTVPGTNEQGPYFVARLSGPALLNDLQKFDTWNIVWAPAGDATKTAKVFKSEGTIRFIDPSELRAARMAGVWRRDGADLFGNTFLEQTLFYGESASSQGTLPQIVAENFELIARGSEEIGMATRLGANARHLFLVKTLGNGETLKAGKSVS